MIYDTRKSQNQPKFNNMNKINTKLLPQFVKSWNGLAEANNEYEKLISLESLNEQEVIKEYSSFKASEEYSQVAKSFYSKAVTGAGATTGQGLVATVYQPLDQIVSVQGGSFISSGVRFLDNQIGSATFPGALNPGHFKAGTSGSTINNDVTSNSPFFSNTAVLNPYTAEVDIYDNPVTVNYIGGAGALFALFETFLANEKLVLSDTLIAASITGSSAVTALATSGATYAPIGSSILKMITNVAKYGTPAVYLNHAGFYKWLDERNSLGDGVKYPGGNFVFTSANGEVPEIGKVGVFAGANVFIVPNDTTDSTNPTGILGAYTTNGSNVITAQTGGTKTVAIVGIPKFVGIAKTGNQNDIIANFSPANNYTAFSTGQNIIAARTHMGSVVINPGTWQYYAF
jgi:hypothetical protein